MRPDNNGAGYFPAADANVLCSTGGVMTQVNRSQDCGNSPKNNFAQELAIALEKGDVDALDEVLAENATCTLATGVQMSRHDFLELLRETRSKPTAIDIDRVVTHGKAGAVNGVSRMAPADLRPFCHIIHFANAKGDRVGHISSYGHLTI